MTNKRTERLRQLMADHRMNAPAVAALLGRKPNTVRIWRCANGHKAIPAAMLELLELKLKAVA